MTKITRNLRIVVLGGLGDCLLHTPFIRHFRMSGAYDRIACMVPEFTLQLFDRNPYIDLLVGCQGPDLALWALPEQDFEVFSPYIRARLRAIRDGALGLESCVSIKCGAGWIGTPGDAHILRQIAQRYGIQLTDESLDMFTAPEDDEWAETFAGGLGAKPIIMLNRRTARSFKEYPRERWQAVVDLLAERATVLELGAPAEALGGVKCIWPLQPLRRTAALFRRARCVVTVDSFSAHLATAVGTPAVVVFGPTHPAIFGHPVNRNIRCAPCDPCFDPDEVGCREPVCLTQLPPQTIVAAVLSILATSPPDRALKSPMPWGACNVRHY
jgi:ADP-heptose:LPS heptosyltransferase